MNLVLLGPPGAGKGTQAVQVSKMFNLVHLSSGDMLRAELKAASELGRKAQGFMDRGVLVPDDVILSMMMGHIERSGDADGFLLDGFPRTLAQATGLDERLTASGQKLDAVVSIDVADEAVVRRLTGRATCPTCGRIYHDEFSPPAQAGHCDDCEVALAHRKDDNPEVVGQRLRTYHEETKPLIAYYRQRGVLRAVAGEGTPDEVSVSIRRACQRP